MADTSIHYMTYDPDAMWQEMMLAYIDAGGDVLYGGDEKEMLLRAVLAIFVQGYAAVDHALRMGTLRYAKGDYLKLLGENRGCAYIDAAKATGKASIQFRTGSGTTLGIGTKMTADGSKYYELTEEITSAGGGGTGEATIQCTDGGIGGNGLTVGSSLKLVIANAAVDSIAVTEETSGGAEAEDEEVYRARIRTYMMNGVTTGPAEMYESAARAASINVIDASAENGGDGVVNLHLILNDDADASAVIAEVGAALSSDTARPLTDQVVVAEATEITYSIVIGYKLADGAALTEYNALVSAGDAYLAWQDYAIGRDFNPNKLMANLFEAGAQRIEYGAASVYNVDGDIVYTATPPGTRLRGTITYEEIAE